MSCVVRRSRVRTAFVLTYAASKACVLSICATFALSIGVPTNCVAATDTIAVVDEPRAFGHTIGDVLVQRVRLVAGGHDGPAQEWLLPSGGRVDVWLERRPARIESAAGGSRWLVLTYQVTNAPSALTQTELPALVLRTRAGDQLRVPAWPISVGPLAPDSAFGAGGLTAVQPDRGPAPLALAPIERRIGLGLAGLVATVLAWLAWWIARNRRDAARLPFARAWREFRRRGMANGNVDGSDDSDAAWRLVHRALNETAGFVVQSSSLPRLLASSPWLQPLRAQLDEFYRRSEARFFSSTRDEPPDRSASGVPPPALAALVHLLYRAERGRHR